MLDLVAGASSSPQACAPGKVANHLAGRRSLADPYLSGSVNWAHFVRADISALDQLFVARVWTAPAPTERAARCERRACSDGLTAFCGAWWASSRAAAQQPTP